MIGGLIGGALFGMLIADVLAFYLLSAIFAYSYDTAYSVFYATIAYVQLPWWLLQTYEHSENYRSHRLRRLHRGAHRTLWYLLFCVAILSIPISWIADATATRSIRYVELAGTWERQGLRYYDMGSDWTSTPKAERNPILRDILSGEVIPAFDDDREAGAYSLIRSRGIKIENLYCKVCDTPELVTQAKAHLETTFFGKSRIVRVEYVEFDILPLQVQKSVVRRLGSERGGVVPLWHLRKTHSGLAELIDQSIASAQASDD